jgi:hypothetical protein
MNISFTRHVAAPVLTAAVIAAGALAASAAQQTIVVCAPGSPGTTDEAQPAMNAFAAAAGAKAGVALAAIYEPTEQGGVARLKDAGLGIVSLPLFLAHEHELGLHARLVAVEKGRPALEQWSLIAQKGRIKDAESLAGFTIISNAAFAPAFIKGPVLGSFGALPASVKLVQSVAVLSALRKAANGEAVAVIADGPQTDALAKLPFGSKLDVVAHSAALPAGLVVTAGDHVPAKTWSSIETALLALGSDKSATTALDGIQTSAFIPVDEKALETARRAYAGAPK